MSWSGNASSSGRDESVSSVCDPESDTEPEEGEECDEDDGGEDVEVKHAYRDAVMKVM